MKLNMREKIQNLFPELNDDLFLTALEKNGKIFEVPQGRKILDYGSFIKTVPLVLSGSIKVVRENSQGNELFLYYLTPGDTCTNAFSCCMMNKRSTVRTIAEEDTTYVGIPVRQADEWINEYVVWKNYVLKSFESRIDEMIYTIDSIAFMQLDERLLEHLYKVSRAANSNIIQVTHQEIADDLNASREAISRLLKKLEMRGQISLGRNKITILDD
jgi:CRP/FNR family transcriptional regulator